VANNNVAELVGDCVTYALDGQKVENHHLACMSYADDVQTGIAYAMDGVPKCMWALVAKALREYATRHFASNLYKYGK